MKTRIISLITLSLSCLSLSALDAQAHMHRNDCFNGGAAGMGRNMGVRNATRLVNALWSRLGKTCDKVDRLAQIISETPLARPTIGGEFAACFYQGYTDTLWSMLGDTYDRCGTQCFNAGSEMGSISAEGYCAASVAVGGLDDPGFIAQPPLPFCGDNLVMGCKASYVQVATTDFAGCSPFTEGAFSLTFDNSVRQDCFVPSDVPIRDFQAFSSFDPLIAAGVL